MDDDDSTMDFKAPARLSRPVSLRTLLAAVVLTALLSIGAGAAISAVLVQRGPAGPPGEEGPAGPRGPAGDAGETSVDPEEVYAAIEEDPARVAEAVADELEFAPAALADDLEDVRSTADEAATAADEVSTTLAGLCTDLGLAQALSDEILSC